MKILIIDDHALFREGLCHVLNSLEDEVSILEAADYDRALHSIAAHPDVDLVLLDLNLPGKDGFTVLDTIGLRHPTLPVVILSASNQHSDVQRALDAGAMGYIPKDTTSSVMLSALRLILSGGIYLPPNVAQADQAAALPANNHASNLTPKQLQVLTLLVRGHSNKDIAENMKLAESTVKMHVTAILKTLGVSNRTQAALAAEKLGLCLSVS